MTVREVGYPREKKGLGREAGPQIIGWCQQGGTISLAPQAPGRKVRCGEQILLGPSRNQSPETQSLYGVALSLAQLRMLGWSRAEAEGLGSTMGSRKCSLQCCPVCRRHFRFCGSV